MGLFNCKQHVWIKVTSYLHLPSSFMAVVQSWSSVSTKGVRSLGMPISQKSRFLLKLKAQQMAASAHSIPHSSLDEAVLVTFALRFLLAPTCHLYWAASMTGHAKARMMTARFASISPCRCTDVVFICLASCRSTMLCYVSHPVDVRFCVMSRTL